MSDIQSPKKPKSAARTGSDHCGLAIAPYWMTRNDFFVFLGYHPSMRVEKMLNEDTICESVQRHSATLYRIRYNDKPDEWVTREEYCLKALRGLCDTLCRVLQIRFRGDWFVIAEGQHGEQPATFKSESLENALVAVLGKLDPLWSRNLDRNVLR